MEKKLNIFDYQAKVGITKHIGNIAATNELIGKCRIRQDSYVLDVGCGVGQTPVYLARKIGCRVMGVDILSEMINKTLQRVEQEGLQPLVDARIADVHSLPFEENSFDAVIVESVLALAQDKSRAMAELVRVCKPGGRVGINETTWLKTPVPQEIIDYINQDLVSHAVVLNGQEWSKLLQDSGLVDISTRVSPISMKEEAVGNFKRYGLGYILKAWGRTLSLYRKDPEVKATLQKVKEHPMPKGLFEYYAYGIYVGTK